YVPPARAIENISAEDATRRLSEASHSIAEIVAHMIFWQEWVKHRCDGIADPLPAHAAPGWPAVERDAWPQLRSRFLDGLEALVKIAEASELDQTIVPPIEVPHMAGMTQRDAMTCAANHNAHHLGQIITLRQLMGLWPPPSGGMTW